MEKRLLGKKVEDEKMAVKGERGEWVENSPKEKRRGISKPERFQDEDIMQNSSKRTVYVNSNDPSLCEICLKVWPAKKHLWQHYIRCHKQVAATVCGICLKTNPSYSSLQTHLRETHPNLLYGCGFGSNFICKICGRYHNASSKLKLHMAIHVGFNESMMDDFKDVSSAAVKTDVDDDTSDEPEPDPNDIDIQEPNLDDIKREIKEEPEHDDDHEDDIDDMNYESLIEEVEVSSDTEEYENGAEYQEPDYLDHDYGQEEQVYSVDSKATDTSSEDEDGSEVDNSDNEVTENELEQEMLKNMIGEGVTIVNEIKAESSNDENYSSIDYDECNVKMEVENWTESAHFIQTLKNIKRDISEDGNVILYQHKEIELDNAIKSIAFNDGDEDGDYSNLNESELETAVGSIL